MARHVQAREERAREALDTESKERVLVGEVISTVALAGQISRELTVSDHGIDMEIEFTSNAGRATGRKLYLQLRSGDSHLMRRELDGQDIIAMPSERHARYWMEQRSPVMVVVRSSSGEVRWMDVRESLRRESTGKSELARHIVFAAERFDVMSVRRWRERALGSSATD